MVRRTKLLPQTQFKEVTTFTTLILHEIYKNACIKIYLLIYLIYLFVLPIFLFPYLFICECICIFKHIHIEKYACPSLSLSHIISTLSVFWWTRQSEAFGMVRILRKAQSQPTAQEWGHWGRQLCWQSQGRLAWLAWKQGSDLFAREYGEGTIALMEDIM